MKNKTAVFLSFILAFSFSAFAQTKTVTNADLEKFRQKRLQAEREYRENYERLGFPSPEELESKRIADEKELIEYSSSSKLTDWNAKPFKPKPKIEHCGCKISICNRNRQFTITFGALLFRRLSSTL